MKIQNIFRTALIATLGVGTGLLIWGAAETLATILTYIGAALFLALGLNPLIRWLEGLKLPRWAALLSVFAGFIVVVTGVILMIVPTLVRQATAFVQSVIEFFGDRDFNELLAELQGLIPENLNIDLAKLRDELVAWITSNIGDIGSGVIQVGLDIANFFLGAVIIIILTIYFVASLDGMKQTFYKLLPASKRERVAELTEKVTKSVGDYVVGQVTLASISGLSSFLLLTILQAWFGGSEFTVILAVVGFLFALIPLIGNALGTGLIVIVTFLLGSPTAGIIAAIYYYAFYVHVDAYFIAPRIMSKAVAVPGSVVVISALAGGALLGVLGALIAIPVAASIIILINEVHVPKQDTR